MSCGMADMLVCAKASMQGAVSEASSSWALVGSGRLCTGLGSYTRGALQGGLVPNQTSGCCMADRYSKTCLSWQPG